MELNAADAPTADATGIKKSAKIWYTLTDEAPALATHAFLPIVRRFLTPNGVQVRLRTSPCLARPRRLPRPPDPGAAQGGRPREARRARQDPRANIIKLPNVSASVPQLESCIAELNAKGFTVPPYPKGDAASLTDVERDVKARYGKVLGSAVNPVLARGTAIAASPRPSRTTPRRIRTRWATGPPSLAPSSRPCATETLLLEQTKVMPAADRSAEFHPAEGGAPRTLRERVPVEALETIDVAQMSMIHLDEFIEEELRSAAANDLMVSLHLKATMMKISDPILFGRVRLRVLPLGV